jgi:hypothetical protein
VVASTLVSNVGDTAIVSSADDGGGEDVLVDRGSELDGESCG